MTRWWNYDDQLEQKLRDWFSDDDLNSWLTCTYEIFVGSAEVKCMTFTLKCGVASWFIHYPDGWCYNAGEDKCDSVKDIIDGFNRRMKDPLKYKR